MEPFRPRSFEHSDRCQHAGLDGAPDPSARLRLVEERSALTDTTVQRIDQATKWTTLLFAWISWIAAIYYKSWLLVPIGVIPYLLLYNTLVRPWVVRARGAGRVVRSL